MSVAVVDPTLSAPLGKTEVAPASVREINPRTRLLLQGPIVITL